MNRFSRTELLFGPAAMQRLRDAHVTVVGLGAVGSYATEGLARSGVGHLRLVDFDVIKPSNANRQLYALTSTFGRPKTDVACERVRDINPLVEVVGLPLFFDETTAADILRPRVDVVVDAIDSVGPKTGLLAACVNAGIPVLSCMGAASRTDPLAISVADIADTSVCPLARHIRKRLKRQGIANGIRCVFSTEPVADASVAGSSDRMPEEEFFVRGRERQPIGSFSCLTGIFGLVAAREVIRHILANDPTRPQA